MRTIPPAATVFTTATHQDQPGILISATPPPLVVVGFFAAKNDCDSIEKYENQPHVTYRKIFGLRVRVGMLAWFREGGRGRSGIESGAVRGPGDRRGRRRGRA